MSDDAIAQEFLYLRGCNQRFARLLDALEKSPAVRIALNPPPPPPKPVHDGSPILTLAEAEKAAITRAMAATGGNANSAARLLKAGKTTIYRKVKEYGIGVVAQ